MNLKYNQASKIKNYRETIMKLENLKINSIEIKNFKNVNHGMLDMNYKDNLLNVIGLYGQNGSGKTTVIEVLSIVSDLISGEQLDDSLTDMFDLERNSTANISFKVNETYLVYYEVKFRKIKKINNRDLSFDESKETIEIISENLSMKGTKSGSQPKTVVSFQLNASNEIEFLPKYRFPKTKINKTVFSLATRESKEDLKSVIFGDVIKNLIKDSKNIENDLKEMYLILNNSLEENIFIYTNRMNGLINTNMNLPIPLHFYYEESDQRTFGVLPLPISRSAKISPRELQIVKKVFEQINIVLPNIIPGLNIGIKELTQQLDNDGIEQFIVEVVSERDGRSIPFRSESDGIKKIVSILSALINSYSSPKAIVAIDELDSGIYEFLLGELLEVLSKGAKGQIIFTSHNLRPLEVLSKENLFFTTVNTNDRYTRKTDIKQNNNMRDVYLRNIQVNNGEDRLYNPTNVFEIQKSFRRAKRLRKDEK